MNSPATRSPRVGGRRPARPPCSSHLHSDCPPESPEDPTDSPSLGQRSVSLTTLQPAVIQPRMAQLETLEAKMASIEVSLSSTPRRKKNGSVSAVSLGSSIRSIPKEIAVKELETLRNALRDKENIIQSLKGQLTIPGLRLSHIRNNNNNNNSNNNNNNRELSDVEKKQAEERLNRLKTDTDNKRLTIKNLKMALERLDITDNIDVRIQQAELEYQLGREELNLLTLLEETRALQLCLEESNRNSSDVSTLYSCIKENENVSLHAIEIVYDPKSPRFGAGQKETNPGLWIDWALDDTGLCKGDRLVEVNGKIVLTKTRDDLSRLLAAAPDPAQIVVLRKNPTSGNHNITIPTTNNSSSKEVAALRSELEVVKERAEEAQRAKDGLRSDNIRLTHRISYLEEQVSELLSRKKSDSEVRVLNHNPVITSTVKTNQNVTNINITAQPVNVVSTNTTNSNDLQVFQKGPQVTALVANLPGLEVSKDSHTSLPVRSKSSLSNVSNTHIPTPAQTNDYHYHKSHRHKHRNGRSSLHSSTQYLETPDNKIAYKKHPHQHYSKEKDYSSETNSTIEHISRQNRKNIENGHHRYSSSDYTRANSEKDYSQTTIMDQSYKKATKIVQELTKNKESNLYEKHRQKCLTASEKYNNELLKHYNSRKSTSVMDFRSEIQIGQKYGDARSTEELDSNTNNTNNAEPSRRLYKKLQESRSVKSLDFDSDCNTNGIQKSVDYTSEPLESNKKPVYYGLNGEIIRPRPTPPKKPLRLSLHRAQSLQSVETPPTTPSSSPGKNEARKPMKRNHKGETPVSVTVKIEKDDKSDVSKESQPYKSKEKQSALKWANFGHSKNKSAADLIENGKWC